MDYCAAYFLVDVDGVLLREGNSFATTLANPSTWYVVLIVLIANLVTIGQDLRSKGWQRGEVNQILQAQVIVRVIVTQFFMIIGMKIAIYLRQPMPILLVLVLTKTALDLLLHWYTHRQLQDEDQSIGSQ